MDPREPLTWGRQPPYTSDPARLMQSFGDGTSAFFWPISPLELDEQALSPDCRRVAFSYTEKIYVMDRGGLPRQIYSSAGNLHGPRWSSDGTRLIFDEDDDIKTIGVDGTGVRTVIRGRNVFGVESPLENPNTVDAVALGADGRTYILALTETRPWDGSDRQLMQLREKVYNYVTFAIDGQMDSMYPESLGHPKEIQVHGITEPDARTAEMIGKLREAVAGYGIGLSVVTGVRQSGT